MFTTKIKSDTIDSKVECSNKYSFAYMKKVQPVTMFTD